MELVGKVMELRIPSQKIEQRLLQLFPSRILVVQSLGEDGRCLYLQPSRKTRQNEAQLQVADSSVMVPGTLKSPEKEDPLVAKGQSQQANSDANKSTDLLLQKSQQSTKSDVSSKQQSSEPSNLSASQTSKVSGVTSESAQPESHHGPSNDILPDQSMNEQETPAGDSKTVTPSSTKLVMELTSKKKHTVHCFLHHFEVKCNLCETAEECQEYDEGFASMFKKFLDKDPNASLPSANNEDTTGVDFMKYIEVHLQARKCPSPCYRLWKYCLDNKLFSFLKYAPEGLLIHSDNQKNAVGTVIDTYLGYRKKDLKMIGFGGFGKVYEFCDEKAVKEESKQPLINGNTLLFQRIMELDHPHVIKVLEYIAGPGKDDHENKCFLSVMPFKNQKDLQKQFTKEKHLTCVLDYMTVFPNQKNFIFRNYTVLFRHVFEGLCYLKSQGIIHRDIKSSNILVHQNCTCQSPLQCICAGDGDVTYLLGDMDLLSLEEESADLTYTLDEWQKMAYHDPAGTIGMKPPESFFRTKKGDRVTNHKSDVWSACVTMMNVLISKTVNDEAQKQIKLFITAATEGTKAALKTVTESLDLLGSIITRFKSVLNQMKEVQGYSELVNNDMRDLNVHLDELKQLLTSGETGLHQSQSFQGGFSEVYKEENPLAGILTTAHGAQVLHWKCLSKLKEKEIYDAQLWTVMEQILDAIVAGIKFVPDKRKDATEILNCLKKIPFLQ